MAYQDTSLILPEPVNNLFLAASETGDPVPARKKWAQGCGSISTSSCSGRSGGFLTLADRQLFGGQARDGPERCAADEPTRPGTDEVKRCTGRSRLQGRGVGVVYVSHRLPGLGSLIASRSSATAEPGTFDGGNDRGELVGLIVGPFELRSATRPRR
jgi:hypothetical protein